MTAASCEISRRRRASPQSRYSGRDSTSRATNSVTVSVAAGKTIIPPTANSASGKISVCIGAATLVATRSRWEPDLGGRLGDEGAAGFGDLVGHQQEGRDGQHQQHTPHDVAGRVHRDGAAECHAVVVVHRADHGPDQRRGQHQDGQPDLDRVAQRPGQEGLEQDGQHRAAEHDQHRRGLAEADRRRGDRVGRSGRQRSCGRGTGHHRPPSIGASIAGGGSVKPTSTMVRSAVGLITSSTGCG